MGTTEKVAKWIVDFDFNQIPQKGLETTKYSILDAIGTALVGAKGHVGHTLTEFTKETGGNPQATVIGNGLKTSMLNAAMINATTSHADDFDDASASFGHAGAVMMPAALAMGEYFKYPGKKLIEGYVTGFEIGYRLRNSMDLDEAETGIHNTALIGPVSDAILGGKMLGLNVEQMRNALAISTSLNSGMMQNFGTDAKCLHTGQRTARTGIMAAMMAGKGLNGDPEIFEAERGFFHTYAGEHGEIRKMTEGLGKSTLAVVDPGHYVKRFPGHSVTQAVPILKMVEKYGVKPEDVEAIEVLTPEKMPGLDFRDHPKTGHEGLFSWPYGLATALVDRKVDVLSFTDEKLARPIIQDLMKRVTRRQYPELVGLPRKLRGGYDYRTVVTLRLKDGRVLSESGERLECKGEQIVDKFRNNAKIGGLAEKKIERVVELMKNLEALKDVSELMENVVI